MQTTKMIFHRDMYYNDPTVPYYDKDKVYEVPNAMVARWMKRGGQIVEVEEKPVHVEDKEPAKSRPGQQKPNKK